MSTHASEVPATLRDLDATFLPIDRMRQLSRVVRLEGAQIAAEMEIGPDHWVYPQHFPGDPIFPGTLIIEAAGQLVALWAWGNGHRGRPRLVRTKAAFHHPVTRDILCLELVAEVQGKRHLQFGRIEVAAGGVRIASIEAVLAILPLATRDPVAEAIPPAFG